MGFYMKYDRRVVKVFVYREIPLIGICVNTIPNKIPLHSFLFH
jgi:hypothetical protein